MAMNASALASQIKNELISAGFVATGEHSKVDALCSAIATAVVNHIQSSAKAVVASGSSAGTHPIE